MSLGRPALRLVDPDEAPVAPQQREWNAADAALLQAVRRHADSLAGEICRFLDEDHTVS